MNRLAILVKHASAGDWKSGNIILGGFGGFGEECAIPVERYLI